MIDSTINFDDQPASLASTGKDFTGGYAVLNIGHWLTWTAGRSRNTKQALIIFIIARIIFLREMRGIITLNISSHRITSLA